MRLLACQIVHISTVKKPGLIQKDEAHVIQKDETGHVIQKDEQKVIQK